MSEEKRTVPRKELSVQGSYRVASRKHEVPIVELSESGCRFRDRYSSLDVGDKVTMKIEELGLFDAVVRWRDHDFVGVEFDEKLYGPVFDHICERLNRNKSEE